MKESEAVAYIHSLPFGTRPGLRRVSALLKGLGNPQRKVKIIHVAGTNGKGSFCAMLSSTLTQAGYRTGLFISPHIISFYERMQMNGQMISDHALALVIEQAKPLVAELQMAGDGPTQFEVVTAVALKWYAEQKADFVVLEVGLGGRLDATNAIETALISVIMSISKDHTEWLGEDIDSIAGEKAAIIKESGTTVGYSKQPPEALRVIQKKAQEQSSEFIMSSPSDIVILNEVLSGTRVLWEDMEFTIPLIGEHQVYNALAVLDTITALQEKGYAISSSNIIKGIENAKNPARLEVFEVGKNTVLLDGAHNQDGVRALLHTLDTLVQGRPLVSLFAMLSDKPTRYVSENLARRSRVIVLSQSDNERSKRAEILAEYALAFNENVFVEPNPKLALQKAMESANDGDLVLVCGSLYFASEVREDILEKTAKK